MREWLKKIVHWWPWPLTLNEKYDRQTKAVLQKVCKSDSICIDVGCFRGDILKAMIAAAPEARHKAFEPVPAQFSLIQNLYGDRVDVYPYALGNANDQTIFHHVVSNPTYSGLQQRAYKGEETINEINVEVRRMDDVIDSETQVSVIKIDVEGGELDVMRGAKGLLRQWHPYIIFEHGIGGADKYGVQPGDVHEFLTDKLSYSICLMGDFLKGRADKAFTRSAFEEQFWAGTDCYFLAVPQTSSVG